MSRKLMMPAALAFGLSVPGGALAQDGAPPATAEARVQMPRLGACVLKRRPDQAAQWMRQYPENRGFQRTAYALSIDACPDASQVGLTAQALRASLWMAAYRRDFASAQPTYAAQDPAWAADVPASAGARSTPWVAVRTYGACVVRARPAAVHALLTAAPASPDEDRAFAAVAPALDSCLASGATMKLNKVAAVSLLAEVAHRLARAA